MTSSNGTCHDTLSNSGNRHKEIVTPRHTSPLIIGGHEQIVTPRYTSPRIIGGAISATNRL